MTHFNKFIAILSLFQFLTISLNAQQSIGLNLGFASYEGDINERNVIIPTEIHPLIGISYANAFSEDLEVGILANISKLTGDDQNFDSRKNWSPNYKFETPVTEILINLKWSPLFKRKMIFYNENQEKLNIASEQYENAWENVYDENGIKLFHNQEHGFFHGKDANENIYVYDNMGHLKIYNKDYELIEDHYRKRVYPYLLAGIGISLYDQKPEVSINNDGNYVDYLAEDFESNYITAAMGAGLGADLSNKITLGVDVGYRYAFTDLMDGISENRDPTDDDWYLVGALRLAYKFTTNSQEYIEYLR